MGRAECAGMSAPATRLLYGARASPWPNPPASAVEWSYISKSSLSTNPHHNPFTSLFIPSFFSPFIISLPHPSSFFFLTLHHSSPSPFIIPSHLPFSLFYLSPECFLLSLLLIYSIYPVSSLSFSFLFQFISNSFLSWPFNFRFFLSYILFIPIFFLSF